MTVQELIDELKKYPSDMKVVVTGYEDGYDDIKPIHMIKITNEPHEKKGWWGEYDDDENGQDAIHLPRYDL